jgi:hypothetical protein
MARSHHPRLPGIVDDPAPPRGNLSDTSPLPLREWSIRGGFVAERVCVVFLIAPHENLYREAASRWQNLQRDP